MEMIKLFMIRKKKMKNLLRKNIKKNSKDD